MSLREHLIERAERGHHPVFEPVRLPPLVDFADLFASTGWYAFDVTKTLPADNVTRSYELTADVVPTAGAEPQQTSLSWNATVPEAVEALGSYLQQE